MQERGHGFWIGARELKARLEAGADLFLMDIREPSAYDRQHIPGARNIPREALADHWGELPRGREIVVICDSGLYAGQVAGMLDSLGYRAGVLIGGMKSWKKTFASL